MEIKKWFGNARSGSLMQSLTPALLALVISIGSEGFNLLLAIIAVIGVASAHLALNLIDDYFDYKADMAADRDKAVRKGFKAFTAKYPYLTDGSASIKDLLMAIFAFSAVASACGITILCFRGLSVLWIALAAGVLGFFYSAPPFKLCYYGLGELVTGVIFGPLLMVGVGISASGAFDPSMLWVSIPVGLLVVNILFTHSYIDYQGDSESDKITLAGLMYIICGGRQVSEKGHRANLVCSAIFNFVPFIMIVVAVIIGSLHPLYLLILIMLPRAIWLFASLIAFAQGRDVISKYQTMPKYLGQFGDWAKIREAHLDWFLARWLTARNVVSGFCTMAMLIRIILLFF